MFDVCPGPHRHSNGDRISNSHLYTDPNGDLDPFAHAHPRAGTCHLYLEYHHGL